MTPAQVTNISGLSWELTESGCITLPSFVPVAVFNPGEKVKTGRKIQNKHAWMENTHVNNRKQEAQTLLLPPLNAHTPPPAHPHQIIPNNPDKIPH